MPEARRRVALLSRLNWLETRIESVETGGGGTGPKGDKGDKGDTGDTGPAGNDGAPGDDGSAGSQGIQGVQGEIGLQGPIGNDGDDGATGADGDDGLSAYQVAVANDFVGNQAQWLASLVGAKGDKGDTGNTGATGSTGAPGTNGSDGNDGAAGAQGIQGVKGDTGIAGTDAAVTNANVNTAIADNRPATKTALLLVKGDVGLGSVDNTADAAKAVLTAAKFATPRNINGTAFDGSANITINAVDSTARVPDTRTITTTAPITGGAALSGNLTIAISAATTGAAGSMSAADKTKLDGIASGANANATDAALSAAYRTLLDSSGSHIAAKVAGTYGLAQGDPLAVSGTGTLYPLNVIYIDAADYPAIGALAAKLRVRCIIEANDVAPTGNFTIGLHAVTRPGTSGGAGLCIYTMAAAIAGSTATQNTPAADSQNIITSADFAVPATGFYVLGIVTTGTIATSAHVHISAQLQMRYA